MSTWGELTAPDARSTCIDERLRIHHTTEGVAMAKYEVNPLSLSGALFLDSRLENHPTITCAMF